MNDALDSLAWWVIAALAGQLYKLRQRLKMLERAMADRDAIIATLRAELDTERGNSNALHDELRRALSGYEQ